MAVTAGLVKELREKTGAGMMDCKTALVETDGNIDEAINWLREKGISKAAKKQSRVAAEGLCGAVVSGNTAIIYELNSETDFVSKNDAFLAVLKTIGDALIASNASNDEEALKATLNGVDVETMLTEATSTIGEKISLRRVTKLTKTDSQSFGVYKHMGGRIVVVTLIEGNNEEVAKDVAMHVAAINPTYVDSTSIPEEVLEQEKEVQIQTALNEGKPKDIVLKMVEGRMKKYKQEICLVDQAFVKNPDQTVEAYCKANSCSVLNFVRLEVGEGIEKEESDFAAEVAAQISGQ